MNITELSDRSERLIEKGESIKLTIKDFQNQAKQRTSQVKALSGKVSAAQKAVDRAVKEKADKQSVSKARAELDRYRRELCLAQGKSAQIESRLKKEKASLEGTQKELTGCARQVKKLIEQYSDGISKAQKLLELQGSANASTLYYGLERGRQNTYALHRKIAKSLGISEVPQETLEGGTIIKSYLRGRKDFVEEFKRSVLPYEVINKITRNCQDPAARARALHTAFCDTPREITDLITELMPQLSAVNSVERGCFYRPSDRSINMNSQITDAEFAEVFQHELGHFVDDALGNVSSSADYRTAFNYDKDGYGDPLDYDKLDKMLDEAFETGAAYDRCVTDILAAVFRNNEHMKRRFYEKGFPYYCHDNQYFDRYNNDAAEIFANIFCIETAQYSHSRDFVKKWFPNLYDQTMKHLYKEKKI